jgi:hypothetical protein
METARGEPPERAGRQLRGICEEPLEPLARDSIEGNENGAGRRPRSASGPARAGSWHAVEERKEGKSENRESDSGRIPRRSRHGRRDRSIAAAARRLPKKKARENAGVCDGALEGNQRCRV